MPTIFTHAVVPLALGAGLGGQVICRRLVLAGVAVAILPDLDVIAFQFEVPYGSDFGHRGFSHSLVTAAIVALAIAFVHRVLQARFARAFHSCSSPAPPMGCSMRSPMAVRVLPCCGLFPASVISRR